MTLCISTIQTKMPTALQLKILLVTLKYDFKVMQREKSKSGTKTVAQGYKLFKWGTVGNPRARVVACCSHISSVIWCLSYARSGPRELRQQSADYLDEIIDAPDYEIGDSDDESIPCELSCKQDLGYRNVSRSSKFRYKIIMVSSTKILP